MNRPQRRPQSSPVPAPAASPQAPTPSPASGLRRPLTVTVTAALCALEALAVLGFAVAFASQLGNAGALGLGGRIFMVVLMVLAAVWQAVVAAKHFSGKAWTRAAVVVWQLFQIILSIQYLTGGAVLVGLLMLVPAAVAMVLVFSPQSRAFLAPDDSPR